MDEMSCILRSYFVSSPFAFKKAAKACRPLARKTDASYMMVTVWRFCVENIIIAKEPAKAASGAEESGGKHNARIPQRQPVAPVPALSKRATTIGTSLPSFNQNSDVGIAGIPRRTRIKVMWLPLAGIVIDVGTSGSVSMIYSASIVFLGQEVVVVGSAGTIGFGIVGSVGFGGLGCARSVLPYKSRTTIKNVGGICH